MKASIITDCKTGLELEEVYKKIIHKHVKKTLNKKVQEFIIVIIRDFYDPETKTNLYKEDMFNARAEEGVIPRKYYAKHGMDIKLFAANVRDLLYVNVNGEDIIIPEKEIAKHYRVIKFLN